MDSETSTKAEVKTVIKQFFSSMDSQDFELMERIIAHDAEMVHIGTDHDEIWRGWEELRAATVEQFEELQSYKAQIKNLRISVSEGGRVAWYSHRLDARIQSGGDTTRWQDARFTGVLEKRDGRWQFVQTHVSLPESVALSNAD